MRRHYLLGSITVLALSGAGYWTWRHSTAGRAPATSALAGPPAAIECAAPPPAGAEPAPLEAQMAPPAKPLSPAQSTAPALPPGFVPSVEPRLLKNPEFRGAMLSQQRVALEDQFRDLPKILGLSPEQSDRLFDLLADQQIRQFDLRWQRPEAGKTFSDLLQDARAKNAAELAELLGPSNMIRYQEFRASLQGRAEVNSVRAELASGADPMRESQYDPMLAVVNLELQRLNQEIADLGPRGVPGSDPADETKRIELTVAANQRILDAARPILSGTQLAGLESLYRRQRQQMEAQDTLNRLRIEAAATASQGFTPK